MSSGVRWANFATLADRWVCVTIPGQRADSGRHLVVLHVCTELASPVGENSSTSHRVWDRDAYEWRHVTGVWQSHETLLEWKVLIKEQQLDSQKVWERGKKTRKEKKRGILISYNIAIRMADCLLDGDLHCLCLLSFSMFTPMLCAVNSNKQCPYKCFTVSPC